MPAVVWMGRQVRACEIRVTLFMLFYKWIFLTDFSKNVFITGFQLYSFIVAASTANPSMISHNVDIIQGGLLGISKSSLSQSAGKPRTNIITLSV